MATLARRTLAIMAGLALGWYAAGFVPLGWSPALAQTPDHPHGVASTPAMHEADHDHGADYHAAQALTPRAQDVTFMRPVIWGVVILFAAAVVLGIPALKLRGPLPPDPAEQAHGHDDHAHDSHGASHAHTHGH